MTSAEIRIAAAKRRSKEAEAALSKAYERQRAERAALTRKQSPRNWTARRKLAILEAHDHRCHICGGKIDGTREAWELEEVKG